MIGHTLRSQYAVFTGLLLLGTTGAQAANWQITPVVEARQIYSDNMDLASDASQADEAMLTEVLPGITISRQSAHLNLTADYKLQQLFYQQYEKDDTETNHLLDLKLASTLYDNYLFFDANAKTGVSLKDTQGTLIKNTASEAQKNRFVQYQLSPYLLHRWHKDNSVLVKYQFDKRDYEDDGTDSASSTSSSYSDQAQFALHYFIVPKLELTADYTVENSHDKRTEAQGSLLTEQYSAALNYRLNADWKLLSRVRGESNERFGQTLGEDGEAVLVGFAWTPSSKLLLSVLAGSQSSLDVDVDYKPSDFSQWALTWRRDTIGLSDKDSISAKMQFHKGYWSWGASHSRQTTTESLLQLASLQSADDTAVSADNAAAIQGLYSNEADIIEVRTNALNLGFKRKKITASFDYSLERREELQNQTLSYLHSADIAVNWLLNRRDEIVVENSWQFRELLAQQQTVDLNSFSVEWLHDFTRDIAGTLQYQYAAAASNQQSLRYVENRVMASVEVNF